MKILAPLRGVTIRAFRKTFARQICEVGFDEAITPFIPAIKGYDPAKDREIADGPSSFGIKVTPQFIGKDPHALRECLTRIRELGFDTADLNCGCPYPMVRNKGRGSGLLKTPAVLEQMLAVGCETMGAGKFSIKTRLGVDGATELAALMPIINNYPLRFLTVHGRIARQMYDGACDVAALDAIVALAKVPVVKNGDLPLTADHAMIGREFVRWLGQRADAPDLLSEYINSSVAELCGDRPVLGRIKELVAYWQAQPHWRTRWNVIKISRSVDELLLAIR